MGHGEVLRVAPWVDAPNAELSDLDVVCARGNPRRCAKTLHSAEGTVPKRLAGEKISVASENLRPFTSAMIDREVAGVVFVDAPVADLDRMIADGDPIRCAQCRASNERVPKVIIVARVKRSVASEDLRGVPAAMADREVVVVHRCNPPVVANLDLTVAN